MFFQLEKILPCCYNKTLQWNGLMLGSCILLFTPSGTGHCELCGNNTMGKEREEVATCFLPAGAVADNDNLNDTVFECACKGNYSGTGIFCEGKNFFNLFYLFVQFVELS